MGKFNIEDYETVDSRIKRFYTDNENGSIITDLENISSDFSHVVVKASIFIDGVQRSTGYAMEIKGQGFVNKDAWLENAETSAIGRALANFNYSGDLRPSREEMSKTQRQPVKPEKGNYEAAIKAINEADIVDRINYLIKLFDDRQWEAGQKEKLLMHAQEKIKALKTVENVTDAFKGEEVNE